MGAEASDIVLYIYGDTDWKDLLTQYDGQKITYDGIGNPLTYRDGMSMTWQNGRQLATLNRTGTTISYQYNGEGIRTGKTVNEVETKYYLDDAGTILAEEKGGVMVRYLFDENGTRIGLILNGNSYFYDFNVQGDVVVLRDAVGTVVVRYVYDAWGKLVAVTDATGTEITESTHVGHMNSFRYRGYYYDAETGFYYLQSRYYDAEVGRFVNADGYTSTGQGLLGNNMFAYCGNNPINREDPSGRFWKEVGNFFKKVGAVIVDTVKTVFGAGSSTVATISETKTMIIPDPSPITVETGTEITKNISQQGDSTKPISVYAEGNLTYPIKSSVIGLKINISKFTLNVNLALDDIKVSGNITKNNTTNGFGIKANLSQLKVGFEGWTTIQWDNNMNTAYTNVNLSALPLAMAYAVVATGQSNTAYSY